MINNCISIVIVDDQPDNLLILQDLLEDEYNIQSFDNGAKAIEYMEAGGRADLILLDIVMPGVDGLDVCRYLKSNLSTRDIPVIFLTSLESEADEAFSLSLGAEDLIHKPFSLPVVLARVRNHLRLSHTLRLLRERNEDFERLTASTAGVGLWDFDVTSGRLTWSSEMLHLHGVDARDFSGTYSNWKALIHPSDCDAFELALEKSLAGDSIFSVESRIVRPDGSQRVVKINGIIRRSHEGVATRVLGNCWDVTDYRQALNQLREAKEQAEAASLAKSNFLSNMSHELRTPLNAILGFAYLLGVDETRPDRLEKLDIISQAGNALLRLVQDILDFSKIEAGKISLDVHEFDLREELGEIMKMFEVDAKKKGLVFEMTIANDLPCHMRGDTDILRQIMMNLIGNALKFTSNGRIEICAQFDKMRSSDDRIVVLFQVSDTGIGIKPENQRRIFEIFEQEDNSYTRRFGGTGLGLAICRRLVNLLDGDIWLESVVGIGSRFFFTASFHVKEPDQESNLLWSCPGHTS